LSVNRVRPELEGRTNTSKTNPDKSHFQGAAFCSAWTQGSDRGTS
jgi:hypothetical protein